MTQFSFEVPIHHLEDFEDLQDFHFLLSIHCSNTRYKQFYLDQALTSNKLIWLDNGWNETGEAGDPIILARLCINMLADVVIAPDDINWDKRQLVQAFERMSRLVSPEHVAVVIKSKEEMQWLSLHCATNFAIPFRYRLTQTYKELEWCKDYHFLGMNHVDEIKTLKPPTLDTSLPIRLALRNKNLDEWIEEGCSREGLWHKDLPDYYERRLGGYTINLARSNIIRLKEVCNELERH